MDLMKQTQTLVKFKGTDSLIRTAKGDSFKSDWSKNLLRCCKWSADGGTVLTEAEDRTIRLFENLDGSNSKDSWEPSLSLKMADSVLSTAWFPHSGKKDPSRYCFVAAVKDHPIHLIDATHGSIRASYPIIDHRERVVAPHSMVFSQDGSTLYAGFDTAIEIFDVYRPGEAGERYKTLPSRKSRDGQKGIISTLAIDSNRKGVLAAGSFSSQIGLYDTQSNDFSPIIVFRSKESTGQSQVKFHPYNDQVLFSASRKSNQIHCWDLRYDIRAFHSFYRPGKTNQRIKFDVDPTGSNLITGGTDGKIRIYRLDDLSKPAQCFKLHSDSISAVEFNPTELSFMTCSGSRRLNKQSEYFINSTMPSDDDSSDDNDHSEDDDEEVDVNATSKKSELNLNSSTVRKLNDSNYKAFDLSTELCLWKYTYT
ncbi:WD40-repeat-containing domain protein [Phakopsora pachyrhizi]|nr:WD40-repeat-containing domain protein [Phakopsora pachyrhizi]